MHSTITNVEFILLQIIQEQPKISGYAIKKIVDERNYKNWTGIGNTSIYTGLKKLELKGYVKSLVDTQKMGKGPLPVKFSLTSQGMEVLKQTIIQTLTTSRERDRVFDLAFFSSSCLPVSEVIELLRQRITFLRNAQQGIQKKYNALNKDELSIFVKKLFEHPIILINAEIEFVENIINELEKEKS